MSTKFLLHKSVDVSRIVSRAENESRVTHNEISLLFFPIIGSRCAGQDDTYLMNTPSTFMGSNLFMYFIFDFLSVLGSLRLYSQIS